MKYYLLYFTSNTAISSQNTALIKSQEFMHVSFTERIWSTVRSILTEFTELSESHRITKDLADSTLTSMFFIFS